MPGYLAIADAICIGGPGLARLAIRYANNWQVIEADAELVHFGHARIGIGGSAPDSLTVITELADTALKRGAATLELTTEHPGCTRTVQRLKFTDERGAEVDELYSRTAPPF
ncbi:hypothetical protein ACQEVG_18885 [Streptomyces sp. CA-135486]|uniref:hypothetical protein n=1 Tax=Streptomyces sp. CA-135486 TaxID=3240049 RepID=UPI003D8A490B